MENETPSPPERAACYNLRQKIHHIASKRKFYGYLYTGVSKSRKALWRKAADYNSRPDSAARYDSRLDQPSHTHNRTHTSCNSRFGLAFRPLSPSRPGQCATPAPQWTRSSGSLFNCQSTDTTRFRSPVPNAHCQSEETHTSRPIAVSSLHKQKFTLPMPSIPKSAIGNFRGCHENLDPFQSPIDCPLST